MVGIIRRGILNGRRLQKISLVRFVSYDSIDETQKHDLEFRQRLKELPDSERFGAFSHRPAVIPDLEAAEEKSNIDLDDDTHIPLGVYNRPHEREWYLAKMKKLFAEEKAEDAVDILYTKMLVQDRVKPNRDIYNFVMSVHCDRGEVQEAKKLLDMMKNYKCRPNNFTYRLFFDACSRASDLQLGSKIATNVYLKLLETDLSHSIYRSAIRSFSKTKNLPMTMRALDDCLIRGHYRPSQMELSSALEACCSDSDIGAGLAVQVWRRFRQIKRFEFRDYHYTLLLKGLLTCGLGDVTALANSISSDGEEFNYRALMTGEQSPDGAVTKLGTEEANVVTVQSERVFDENLILTSPINLLNLQHALPDKESFLSILEVCEFSRYRRLSLLGGLEGLVKTMTDDQVKLNKFHLSFLHKMLPNDNPTVEKVLRSFQDSLDDCDSVLVNSYLSTRQNSPEGIVSEMQARNMESDVVTYGILSRHAYTIPLIDKFVKDITSSGMNLNEVMCWNMFDASGLRFDVKSYILDLMVKHDVSPSAEMIEKIERYIHEVRERVISKEQEPNEKRPGYTLAFHIFCSKYCDWLKKVAIHPDDLHRLKYR